MRSLNLALLGLLGGLLAAGNLWFAAVRSTIPLRVGDGIKSVERRTEKHPGHDDVFLLHLQSGHALQVDPEVARMLQPGDRIEKQAWQRELQIGSRSVNLQWSADTRGMVFAMPAALMVMIFTAVWITTR